MIGKKNTENRSILVKFKKFNDKIDFICKVNLNKKHESIIVRNADMGYEKYDIENIQNRFCKRLLHVNKKCMNFTVLGELGRYPI